MKANSFHNVFFPVLLLLGLLSSCTNDVELRKQIDLNGEWEIARTQSGAGIPTEFPSVVPVPGLVDMAEPPLQESDTAFNNSLYWYRRTFSVDNSDVLLLRINKSKYYTKVYINGFLVGEKVLNITPAEFDIKPFLIGEGGDNELVISVGSRNNLQDTVISGHDFEKNSYVPGIFDEVGIISSSYPFILNVQTVPEIDSGSVHVIAVLKKSLPRQRTTLHYTVRQAGTDKLVAEGKYKPPRNGYFEDTVGFDIELSEVKLWSPEEPVLYDLELSTKGDRLITRFGMRKISADSGKSLQRTPRF